MTRDTGVRKVRAREQKSGSPVLLLSTLPRGFIERSADWATVEPASLPSWQRQTAGLFAPVELLVVNEPGDRSSITYVRPSSLMVVESNPPLLAAALALDEKLEALVRKVT